MPQVKEPNSSEFLRKLSEDSGPMSSAPEFPENFRVGGRKISAPSCQALRTAVSTLYRMDDFHMVKIGSGFFSEVFKATHKTSQKVMVLKMNKHRSNRNNMLKEVQLMNRLNHPNILRLEAACVHEGQLHALTEYINCGSLEQLIQRKEMELPWSVRMSLALDMAKGLAYLHSKGMFHRDLTSKNVLINRNEDGRLMAVIGDFGLASKIPNRANKLENIKLPQVGSPYWMSPECLRGKYYDERADVFSYGIIMCELIGRVDADPDILPRTENFGVDYIAFSAMCPSCPPDFLKLAFNCVKIDPLTRPSAADLCTEVAELWGSRKRLEANVGRKSTALAGTITLRKVGHKRSLSEEEIVVVRRSPSEKARLHNLSGSISGLASVMSVGKEMSMRDPYYRPTGQNPFLCLPRLRDGKKLTDHFSSCFELPRMSEPAGVTKATSLVQLDKPRARFEDHLFQGRVELLKRLYSGGLGRPWTTLDDSVLSAGSSSSGSVSSMASTSNFVLRRRGSCESGFCSVGTVDDWLMGSMGHATSMGSSLLTVSDLEEDLRAASAFLSNKRTSSIFTDSTDDLSSLTDDAMQISNPGKGLAAAGYEKDIRDIVDYFEATASCRVGRAHHMRKYRPLRTSQMATAGKEDISLPRSQKIESLIKRVVEKESRDRIRRTSTLTTSQQQQQRQQVCDGIVRSKLPIFDDTKRSTRSRLSHDHQGFVKARLAFFDKNNVSGHSMTTGNAKKLAEKRLLALANANKYGPVRK